MTSTFTAREVRDVLGHVDVGRCRVSYNHLSQAFRRFPWRVYGPANTDGDRELLDEFAKYTTAIRYARAVDDGRPTDGIDD